MVAKGMESGFFGKLKGAVEGAKDKCHKPKQHRARAG